MENISFAQAKAHLSEILNQVAAGDEVVITRHGQPVARICPYEKPLKSVPVERLAAFRAQLPGWRKPSAELLREIRDED